LQVLSPARKGDIMKNAKVVLWAVMGLFLACGLLAGYAGAANRSDLEGSWYSGGDRNKVARIVAIRDGLEARNENGQVTRLESDGRRRVRALDWGGVTGEVRGDRIEWSNNTHWIRPVAEDRGRGRHRLEGRWYSGGDRNKETRIEERRDGWEARNEHGQTSRLVPDGRDHVRAVDWGNARGEIHGNRIEWSNKTVWTKRPNR